MMNKWANDGILKANDGEILLNDGEMSELSYTQFTIIEEQFTIINNHFTIIARVITIQPFFSTKNTYLYGILLTSISTSLTSTLLKILSAERFVY